MLAPARFLIDMNNLLDIRDRVIVAAGSTSGLGRAIAMGFDFIQTDHQGQLKELIGSASR